MWARTSTRRASTSSPRALVAPSLRPSTSPGQTEMAAAEMLADLGVEPTVAGASRDLLERLARE